VGSAGLGDLAPDEIELDEERTDVATRARDQGQMMARR
jgi:hypothetical protein